MTGPQSHFSVFSAVCTTRQHPPGTPVNPIPAPRRTRVEWPESVMKRSPGPRGTRECIAVAIQPFRESPQRVGFAAGVQSRHLRVHSARPSRVDPAPGVMTSVRHQAIRSYGTFRWSTYFGRRQVTSRFRSIVASADVQSSWPLIRSRCRLRHLCSSRYLRSSRYT